VPSTCSPLSLSVSLSLSLSIYLSIYLSVSLHDCSSSICISIFKSLYTMALSLFISLSLYLYTRMLIISLSLYLFISIHQHSFSLFSLSYLYTLWISLKFQPISNRYTQWNSRWIVPSLVSYLKFKYSFQNLIFFQAKSDHGLEDKLDRLEPDGGHHISGRQRSKAISIISLGRKAMPGTKTL
jgi:hypothetical protein